MSEAIHRTDTTAHAHVLLPSLAWGEKDGTVTNSERRISRQRAFLSPPGDARADWWQLAEVGKRMGWSVAFLYRGPADIFAEHARLSATGNDGARDFDIGALGSISPDAYDSMPPIQWPAREVDHLGCRGEKRFFADGGFFTPDRRARFVAVAAPVAPEVAVDARTFLLNTGRVRDQWHTMTRTGKAARLMSHIAEPFLEIHPHDARMLDLTHANIARISSRTGSALLRVLITDRQQRGSVYAPMHWTDQFAPAARVGGVVTSTCDPISGQPALKKTRVEVEPFRALSYAVAVTRQKSDPRVAAYAAISPVEGGWRIEAADTTAPAELVRRLLGETLADCDTLTYSDATGKRERAAHFVADRLLTAVFCASRPVEVSRTWLASLLAKQSFDASERLTVLAGRAAAGQRERGAIVCACLEVGANDILAVTTDGARSVDAVGAATGAGTNCGSCRAEIGRLIDAARLAKAG